MNRVAGRIAAVFALTALIAAAPGCALFGAISHTLVGGEKEVEVEARYTDLAGKRVAVLVAADRHGYFNYRDVEGTITHAISSYLKLNVDGIQIMSPDDVAAFKSKTPAWITLSNTEIMQRMNVDRLVYVNVLNYSTHEPGDSHVWQGVISGTVGVAEVESTAAMLAFNETIAARFPNDTSIGVVDADEEMIEDGMVRLFASRASKLFYEHTKMVKR